MQQNKNILILASARSGSHALASSLRCLYPDIQYLKEICRAETNSHPWLEIASMFAVNPMKLAHITQARSKIFLVQTASDIKRSCVTVELRRRDKVRQFGSWVYFRHLGAQYNFDHKGANYVDPGSITVDMQDIEQFLVEQIIDMCFDADFVVYYEDLDLTTSLVQPNQYAYPIEQCIKNLDLVQTYLRNWQYLE